VNSIHPWGVETRLAEDPEVATLLRDNPSSVGSFGSILPSPAIAKPMVHRRSRPLAGVGRRALRDGHPAPRGHGRHDGMTR
jgi:hypothetical protein